MTPLHLLKVGELYNPDRRSWPETPHLRMTDGGIELALFLGDPSDDETAAVRAGDAEFGLWSKDGVIFFLARFGPGPKRKRGAVGWLDALYDPQRDATVGDTPDVAALTAEARSLVTVVLVDASNGIVRAIRAVTLSPDFTRLFYHAVHERTSSGVPASVVHAEVGRLQRIYTSEQLARLALVRCRGGA